MTEKITASIYLFFLGFFIIFPMLIILAFSFTDSNWHFSLQNFTTIFHHKEYLSVFKRSVVIGGWTTFYCLIIAYPVAYFIHNTKSKYQNFLLLLLIVPMWTNFLLRTTAWVKILGNKGFVNNVLGSLGFSSVQFLYNEKAIIFGMVYNLLPFMILPIYNALKKIDSSYLEASYDLGASHFYTFYKIIFPLSLSGIKSGIFLVFIPCITFFAVSELLGGVKNMMVGNLINQIFFFLRDWHLGSAVSILLILLFLLLVILLHFKILFRKNTQENF